MNFGTIPTCTSRTSSINRWICNLNNLNSVKLHCICEHRNLAYWHKNNFISVRTRKLQKKKEEKKSLFLRSFRRFSSIQSFCSARHTSTNISTVPTYVIFRQSTRSQFDFTKLATTRATKLLVTIRIKHTISHRNQKYTYNCSTQTKSRYVVFPCFPLSSVICATARCL